MSHSTYERDEFDDLWDEIMAQDPEIAVRYCRERGIDVEGLRKRLLKLLEKLKNSEAGQE